MRDALSQSKLLLNWYFALKADHKWRGAPARAGSSIAHASGWVLVVLGSTVGGDIFVVPGSCVTGLVSLPLRSCGTTVFSEVLRSA
jgi:hypothetical protein